MERKGGSRDGHSRRRRRKYGGGAQRTDDSSSGADSSGVPSRPMLLKKRDSTSSAHSGSQGHASQTPVDKSMESGEESRTVVRVVARADARTGELETKSEDDVKSIRGASSLEKRMDPGDDGDPSMQDGDQKPGGAARGKEEILLPSMPIALLTSKLDVSASDVVKYVMGNPYFLVCSLIGERHAGRVALATTIYSELTTKEEAVQSPFNPSALASRSEASASSRGISMMISRERLFLLNSHGFLSGGSQVREVRGRAVGPVPQLRSVLEMNLRLFVYNCYLSHVVVFMLPNSFVHSQVSFIKNGLMLLEAFMSYFQMNRPFKKLWIFLCIHSAAGLDTLPDPLDQGKLESDLLREFQQVTSPDVVDISVRLFLESKSDATKKSIALRMKDIWSRLGHQDVTERQWLLAASKTWENLRIFPLFEEYVKVLCDSID